MSFDVVCLRPEADFLRVGITPPATLRIAYRAPENADLKPLIATARALVMPAVGPRLSAGLFEGSILRLVQVTGAGVDRLDEEALKRLGIPVANVPGGSNSAVAEYVLTAASMLLRRFAWSDTEVRSGRYREFRAALLSANLFGLHGLTVGIIGMGTIGLAVAQALRVHDCEILYADPSPRDAKAASKLDARPVSLDELLERSDVVTIHVPLLSATQGLIGEHQLARMKKDAILVNAARGGIVDETALAAALLAGRIGGAAVDVYSTEPPEASNPLLGIDGEPGRRLLLTPHIAGVTRQAQANLFRSAWENVERVLSGGLAPLNRVY
ncbi:MAG TPA: NAD(P)-dependent oxidoreductase [Burkholderiales bacterium]|nr:NAD(P)-dependent oxidoreductase [Burkholderiales bacterium]